MKRKWFKAVVITAVMVGILAMPVMAQEVTDPKTVYTEDKFVVDETKLIEDFHKGEVWRCENYLEYLDGVIFNLQETARVKKEIVTNFTELSKVNPYFKTLLPRAIQDYNEAVAWVDAYKAYRKAVSADLKVRYNY